MMPRKNPRPAARKRAAKLKLSASAKPKQRIGAIAHPGTSGIALAMLAAFALGREGKR